MGADKKIAFTGLCCSCRNHGFNLLFGVIFGFYPAGSLSGPGYKPEPVLLLERRGLVIKAEPLNQDAEELLKGLQLQGKDIQEALSLILDGAYAGNYLSAEKENIILISLAAPESYVISENDLRVLVSERILNIEVDTYLKITTLEPQKALEARNKNLPVNLLVLEEQMAEKGLTEIGEEESCPQKKAGPPPTVQDFWIKSIGKNFRAA